MTDSTQELDEILVELCKNTQADYGYQKLVPSETAKAKQALLDWHNKQVEEVLDRLDQPNQLFDEQGRLLVIEAERNKLKESK